MPPRPDSTVAVIGGGIAGTSVAYHLAREADAPVVLYERDSLGAETTAKSAAFFGFYGTDLERRMKRYGMAVYNDRFRDAGHLRYEHVGRLRVATTDEGAETLRSYADGRDGVRALEPGEIHEILLVPDLDVDPVEVATYRPHVGYLGSRELAETFATRAREASDAVRIETGTAVEDVVIGNDGVEAIVAGGECRSVAHAVCAAGPWNPRLASLAGIDLPVSHSLAPILRVDHDPGYPVPIVSHHETGVYARGDGDGALLGRYPTDPEAGVEYDPDDVPGDVPDDLRETIRGAVERLLPPLADAPVVEEWVGVRSHTPDGHPIAGRTSVEGFSIAAFDSSGIQLAPAVGRTIAREIAGIGDPFAADLAPDRF